MLGRRPILWTWLAGEIGFSLRAFSERTIFGVGFLYLEAPQICIVKFWGSEPQPYLLNYYYTIDLLTCLLLPIQFFLMIVIARMLPLPHPDFQQQAENRV